MTVREFSEKSGFAPIALPDGDREITGAYIGDLLSWVMGRATTGDAWITIMSNINIIAVASLADAACVILAEGVELDEKVTATAEAKGVNVLSAPCGAFDAACRLNELI